MHSFRIRIFIAFIICLMVGSFSSFAQPVEEDEILKFQKLIKEKYGLEDLDKTEDFIEYFRKKVNRLKSRVNLSAKEYVELGDTLHLLGHFYEHKYDYKNALLAHEKSYFAYSRTGGLRVTGSWGDGREHTLEHIFMDYFDWSVLLSRQGKKEQALEKLKLAYAFAKTNKLRNRLGGVRFQKRYRATLHRFQLPKPLLSRPMNFDDEYKWGNVFSQGLEPKLKQKSCHSALLGVMGSSWLDRVLVKGSLINSLF